MIRVLIAEDQTLVRGALAALLAMEEEIEVVAEAADGEEAINQALATHPDIALVDIEMPKLSGLSVIEHLSDHEPSCKTLILTTFARPGYLQRAIRSGASGYILKDARIEDVVAAIFMAHRGQKIFNTELMMDAMTDPNPLTDREIDILRLVKAGLSTRDIAARLYLSEGTIRNYMSEVLAKLAVQSRQEAVRKTEEQGWL